MKYTTSLEADKKIEQDMKIIKEIILKNFNPISIVLFGGFGHGGGSFRKIGEKITPLNDYDMYIVSKKKIDDKKLEIAGEECSRAIGKGGLEIVENFNESYDENKFFHVDLHSIGYGSLKKMFPTQRTADLKTSTIIYGDKKVLEQIPKLKISKSDSIRLLFNKINHFAIAEGNLKEIKSIYSVKGLIDLCSAILIYEGKYNSRYQEREKAFESLKGIPEELKKWVKKATDSKLDKGYKIDNVEEAFIQSKKWVEWTLKKILKDYLRTKSEDWTEICNLMYKKLPYTYFSDYLRNKYLFPAQYYLNIKFFFGGLRKKEFLIKNLFRWKDAGLIVAISLILYFFNEKKEAERYLRKLTNKTKPLKDRILKLYSIYYLQKMI